MSVVEDRRGSVAAEVEAFAARAHRVAEGANAVRAEFARHQGHRADLVDALSALDTSLEALGVPRGAEFIHARGLHGRATRAMRTARFVLARVDMTIAESDPAWFTFVDNRNKGRAGRLAPAMPSPGVDVAIESVVTAQMLGAQATVALRPVRQAWRRAFDVFGQQAEGPEVSRHRGHRTSFEATDRRARVITESFLPSCNQALEEKIRAFMQALGPDAARTYQTLAATIPDTRLTATIAHRNGSVGLPVRPVGEALPPLGPVLTR